jgi:erythromycin esterase-like protein
MRRALVAAVGSLLVTLPALADESPAASTSVERVAAAPAPAVTGDATPATTSERTDNAAVHKSRRASADDAANKSEASQVKQVPLKASNDGTVCHKEYPTGSRIGVKRCYSTTETAVSKVQNDIMRRDIEEMRDRQMYEQLQRASVGMGRPPAVQSAPGR